jgi:hypothetical protein
MRPAEPPLRSAWLCRCCVVRRGAARPLRCLSSCWRLDMAAPTSQSDPVPSVSPSPGVWLPSALLSAWLLSWAASWARQLGTRCARTSLLGANLLYCLPGFAWRFTSMNRTSIRAMSKAVSTTCALLDSAVSRPAVHICPAPAATGPARPACWRIQCCALPDGWCADAPAAV